MDGDVSLAGGPNEFEGRVELCVSGNWVQVCGNDGWIRPIPGNVVCNHTANCMYFLCMVTVHAALL